MSDRFSHNRIELRDINELAKLGNRLVEQSDAAYKKRVMAVADHIDAAGARLVMVAGPSSSGKTTSSNLIARELRRRGKHSVVISMDDFFKYPEDVKTRKADGSANYETIEAVDVEYMHSCALRLIAGETVEMPHKSNPTAQREIYELNLGTSDDSVLIIEGLHALNPQSWEPLPHDKLVKVYATLFDEFVEDGEPFLSTSEIRISRRLLRDAAQRNQPVERTLGLWDLIEWGATNFVRPYREHADCLLNTSFNCELGILKGRIMEVCAIEGEGGEFRDKLLALGEKFARVESVSAEALPKDSMIREFLGGLEL